MFETFGKWMLFWLSFAFVFFVLLPGMCFALVFIWGLVEGL